MLGIKVKGENHFELKPVVGGHVENAKGSYKSIYGEVRSSWERIGDKVRYRFEIPCNTTADLYLKDKHYSLESGTYFYEI